MVTGACYLLETDTTKVLVDCGMFQGSRFSELLNHDPFPFDPTTVDVVLLTHAHIDHVGRLPKLVKEGFRGKIYATSPTLDFARALLADAAHVMRSEQKWEGTEPLYEEKDTEAVFPLTIPVAYNEKVPVAPGMTAVFHDAGHILGSSIIEAFVSEKGKERPTKVVFSGDLGNSPTPLLNDTTVIHEADFALIESAYGDRMHESHKETKDMLEDVIEETIAQGGVLLIPSFATERTQELLYELNELVEHGRIPKVPVFIDSPLAIKITEVYKKHPEFYNKKAADLVRSGDNIFQFPGLRFTPTPEDSKAINAVPPPKIIVAGSGMSHGGRILHHEKLYLSDPRTTLLIIGYQAAGSLGRRLLEGAPSVRIIGADIPVRARITRITGYSAHADQRQLLAWVEPMRMSLKKLFVVQGEAEVSSIFAQLVRDKLAVEAVVPKVGDSFELK